MMYLIFLLSLRSSYVVMHSGATETLSVETRDGQCFYCMKWTYVEGKAVGEIYPDLLCGGD